MVEFAKHFPLLSIITAFVSVVLCSLLPRKHARITAALAQWICAVFGLGVLLYTLQNGNVIYQMGHLTHKAGDSTVYYWFNNVIRFGIAEGIFAAAFPVILFFTVLGGTRKLREDVAPEKEKYYYVLCQLTLVSLIALIYADDTFTGYVFLEISTLSSIGLVAIKNRGRTTVAAIRYMIFNLVGSGLYLIGIVLLYELTGYFMMEKIFLSLSEMVKGGESLPAVTCSLALITVGLGIKSGLFPFYFWMPDTYGEATTSSAGIISGLISKGYILLLIKFLIRTFGYSTPTGTGNTVTHGVVESTGLSSVIFLLGACGMIFGSLSAIFEKRINKMIAFSSAAQIGYIYLALGMGETGIVAALYQILAHAVTKPLLFLSARGMIDVSDHEPHFYALRGSGLRNKTAGIGFTVGALSMIGFPLFAGFAVKYLFLETAMGSAIPVYQLVVTVVALTVSTLLNTIYFIRTVITAYSHRKPVGVSRLPEKSGNYPGYYVSVLGLSSLNFVLGMAPVVSVLLNKGVSVFGYIPF